MRKAARKAAEALKQKGEINELTKSRKRLKRDESRYNKDGAHMRRVTEAEFFDGRGPVVGLFFWKDIVREINGQTVRCRGIFARYPDGSAAHLPVRPVPDTMKDVNGGHSWQWDGNEDAPTLSPSVHIMGAWHGYVRDGRMVSC